MGFLWRAKGFLDDLLGNSKYLNKKEDKPSELSVWNKFIYEVCDKDLNELSEIQKAAALCFRYDAEMQSGGYSSFFDCCPDIAPEELIAAINLIGNKKIANNFRKALKEKALYDAKEEADDYDDEDDDGYETVDNEYYEFEPSLDSLLMEFVEKNKDEIFGGNK